VQRTGWVVLSAVLSELVLIGALANQWMTTELERTVRGEVAGRQLLAESWLTYSWRATPKAHNNDLWASQLTLIGVVLLVSGLLIWCLVRGTRPFWPMFFASWTGVVVATQVGAVARGLVNPSRTGAGRVTSAVFGATGPDARTFIGGLTLGLVTGLLAALVAVATRKPAGAVEAEPEEPFFPPRQPPPYYGEQPTTRQPQQQRSRGYLPQEGQQPQQRQQIFQSQQTAQPERSTEQPTTQFWRQGGDDQQS
jgi:hypothetical protein